MFFYDYENDNALGPHRGASKSGAIYVSSPCLKEAYQPKLENIFVFYLFNSIDRETFKNEIVLSRIIEELNFLEHHEIIVELPDGPRKMYFELSLSVRDNLGQHSILGFVESFNATIICIECLIKIKDIH